MNQTTSLILQLGLHRTKLTQMKTQVEKNAGIALIVFTLLMVFTMILHPVGGSFEYLLKVTSRIITTHVIALVSLPFAYVGFWGLTKKIGTENFFSVSGFAMILFGLVAVMMAATANGLVLPIFIHKYEGSSQEVIESLKPLMRYNFSVNNAFDYIYTGAFSLSMLFFSIAILYTKRLPGWLAYLGILLATAAVLILIITLNSGSLQGFRLFVTSVVLWISLVGVVLLRVGRRLKFVDPFYHIGA